MPTVWLYNPPPQNSLVGDVVGMALMGGDSDGNSLSYASSGTLPPGLAVVNNMGMGYINGTIQSTALGAYSFTVTANSAGGSASEIFAWNVAANTPMPLHPSS